MVTPSSALEHYNPSPRFRYHTTMTTDRQTRRRQFLDAQDARMVARIQSDSNLVLPAQPFREASSRQIWRRRRGPGTSDFRRDVYVTDLWAQPLGDVGGRSVSPSSPLSPCCHRYRECSPEWYRTNEAQTHRLVPWLNRELLVLLELSGQQGRQAHLIQSIVDWVKLYHINSPELRDLLLPYLGVRTDHFQHELLNFARTPFDLVGYDRHVTYSSRSGPHTEVVSSGSGSEGEAEGDLSVQFIDEVRTRLADTRRRMQESLGRFNGMLEERLAANPSLAQGVTRFPEREPRAGPSTGVDWRPRSASGEGGRSRSRDRDYRREMDRFWDIRNRLSEGEREEGGSRRKGRKPTRLNRGGEGGEEAIDLSVGRDDEIDLSVAGDDEIDLSVGGEEEIDLSVDREEVDEDCPSTSRGPGGGLERLVIPESGSEGGDSPRLVVDVVAREEEQRERQEHHQQDRKEGKEEEIIENQEKQKLSAPSSESEDEAGLLKETTGAPSSSSSSRAPDFIPLVPTISPGYYTGAAHQGFYPEHQPHQGYYTSSYPYPTPADRGLQYMSDLTALHHDLNTVDRAPLLATPPLAQQEEDNSDLEVLDVVQAKIRKPREVQVVELSDSSDQDSDAVNSRANTDASIRHELSRQAQGFIPHGFPPDPEEPIVILSSDEEEEQALGSRPSQSHRMQLNTLPAKARREVPLPDSSSDDDLILVKSEPCTIDPITKKQITEPVRNKKCNHIYEKSTIYGMIEQARENSKPVRCPYMGCNQKDFKKTDLVKDKEVLKHLGEKKDEKERADLEKVKQDELEREERRRRREEDGEASADSIVEEVVAMIREEREQEVGGEEQEATTSPSPTSSAKSSSEETRTKSDNVETKATTEEKQSDTVLPEVSKGSKRKSRKTPAHVMSGSSSDSDAPLSRRARSKRKKKAPRKLDDSFSGSEFDEAEGDQETKAHLVNRVKVIVKPPKKRLKIVAKDSGLKIIGKKVTETWSIEQGQGGGSKRKDRKRQEPEPDLSDLSEEEEEPVSRKGKSSSKRPPKNGSVMKDTKMEVQVCVRSVPEVSLSNFRYQTDTVREQRKSSMLTSLTMTSMFRLLVMEL